MKVRVIGLLVMSALVVGCSPARVRSTPGPTSSAHDATPAADVVEVDVATLQARMAQGSLTSRQLTAAVGSAGC